MQCAFALSASVQGTKRQLEEQIDGLLFPMLEDAPARLPTSHKPLGLGTDKEAILRECRCAYGLAAPALAPHSFQCIERMVTENTMVITPSGCSLLRVPRRQIEADPVQRRARSVCQPSYCQQVGRRADRPLHHRAERDRCVIRSGNTEPACGLLIACWWHTWCPKYLQFECFSGLDGAALAGVSSRGYPFAALIAQKTGLKLVRRRETQSCSDAFRMTVMMLNDCYCHYPTIMIVMCTGQVFIRKGGKTPGPLAGESITTKNYGGQWSCSADR